MKKIINTLKKYLGWILGLLGIIIFWYLTNLLMKNRLENFDNFIYNFIKPIINERNTNLFLMITELGNYIAIIIILVFIYIFSKDKKFKKYATINAISVFVLNYILKKIFGRPRPLDINLILEKGFSFPSGHSMESFAFYGFIVYYVYKSNLSKKKKWLIILLLSILVILIGLSRVYLGVHYASDVLAGFSIALAYLSLFINLFYKNSK